jgi:hypothetical protein
VLEGWNLTEGMPRHVRGGRTTRSENIDRDKLVIDTLFLQRKAHGPHVDAIRRAENDRLLVAWHFTDLR